MAVTACNNEKESKPKLFHCPEQLILKGSKITSNDALFPGWSLNSKIDRDVKLSEVIFSPQGKVKQHVAKVGDKSYLAPLSVMIGDTRWLAFTCVYTDSYNNNECDYSPDIADKDQPAYQIGNDSLDIIEPEGFKAVKIPEQFSLGGSWKWLTCKPGDEHKCGFYLLNTETNEFIKK